MRLKIITPKEQVYDGDVTAVNLPGAGGQLTILPGHTFLLSPLKAGPIRFSTSAGQQFVTVSSGLVEVHRDVVTVLASTEQ